MFKRLRKKREPSPYEQLRGSILANERLDKMATYSESTDGASSPWYHFAAAHRLVSTDTAAAQKHLRNILELSDIESRTYLQAWHCLRMLGVEPDDPTRREVIGMAVEVGLGPGLDSVAAYKDRSARYFNHSGAAVIWDTETSEMNAQIESFLGVAQTVGENTEPFDEDHPSPPDRGMMLINILTPGGIHIGMGPMNAMQGDPLGAAVTETAIALMQALMNAAETDGEQDTPAAF
jgi:hypothetical protein